MGLLSQRQCDMAMSRPVLLGEHWGWLLCCSSGSGQAIAMFKVSGRGESRVVTPWNVASRHDPQAIAKFAKCVKAVSEQQPGFPGLTVAVCVDHSHALADELHRIGIETIRVSLGQRLNSYRFVNLRAQGAIHVKRAVNAGRLNFYDRTEASAFRDLNLEVNADGAWNTAAWPPQGPDAAEAEARLEAYMMAMVVGHVPADAAFNQED